MHITAKISLKSLMEMINFAEDKGKSEEIIFILSGKIIKNTYHISTVYQIENILHSANEYCPNKELFLQFITTRYGDKKFIGIFHNHPFWPEKPSEKDINNAGFAGIYLIYSNISKNISTWVNEGSDDPSVNYAMYNNNKGLGPAKLEIISELYND